MTFTFLNLHWIFLKRRIVFIRPRRVLNIERKTLAIWKTWIFIMIWKISYPTVKMTRFNREAHLKEFLPHVNIIDSSLVYDFWLAVKPCHVFDWPRALLTYHQLENPSKSNDSLRIPFETRSLQSSLSRTRPKKKITRDQKVAETLAPNYCSHCGTCLKDKKRGLFDPIRKTVQIFFEKVQVYTDEDD